MGASNEETLMLYSSSVLKARYRMLGLLSHTVLYDSQITDDPPLLHTPLDARTLLD